MAGAADRGECTDVPCREERRGADHDRGNGGTENGAGQRERIFTPFYTTKPTGIGMGLSISRALVEANGGRLWGEPSPGRGASFHFTLPFAP